MYCKINFIIGVLFSCLCFSSCTEKVDCLVDNPTDKDINFTLDNGEKYTVKSKDIIHISLPLHAVNITLDSGEKFKVSCKLNDKVLINPTLSEYFIEKKYYYTDDNVMLEEPPLDTVIIGFMAYTGNFSSLGKNYVYKNLWDASFDEELDDNIVMLASDKYKRNVFIKRKLMRYDSVYEILSKDFIKILEESNKKEKAIDTIK